MPSGLIPEYIIGENIMKLSSMTMAALAALLLATACETVEGFGRDVEKGGDNIEESAKESK